jgi:NAD(P)H dehydrogenase (quinone)
LIAADLLLRSAGEKDLEIVYAEGPRRYSANDVATAQNELLGQTISVEAVPRLRWRETFEQDMSASLAELLIKANYAQNKGGLVEIDPNPGKVRYGTTKLIDALRPLIPPL